MTPNAQAFDDWIRSRFVVLNTALEELYFAQEDRAAVEGVGDDIKQQIVAEGDALIAPLVAEGNTDEGFDAAFDLLGNLGFFLAALRRHELTNPQHEHRSPFEGASALGLHVAASLGMAPRFATSHLASHNRAVDGVYKTFTTLKDEAVFIEYNTRGIFCMKRAADALRRIVPLGISHPVALMQLQDATVALQDSLRNNEALFAQLDADRFFFNVRPYYKPYRVGRQVYRGANAGDFAGINEVDLLLGLCRGSDPFYSQILVEKSPFMRPEDQARLHDCLRRRDFLSDLLDLASAHRRDSWFQANARAFVEVCDAFAVIAEQHHDQLVRRFIDQPSAALDSKHLETVTASGPPLPVLMASLERLRDLRMARHGGEYETRHRDLDRLRALLV